MSFVVILVEGSLCIPGHVSRTCSCVSIFSGHFRHFVSLYLPLKLFFTSSILVLALNIIDASSNVARAVFPLAPWKYLPPLHIIGNTA